MIKDLMIDLETMSTAPDASVVAIGAVEMDFENNKLGREFYAAIDLVSSVEGGGHLCPDTVMWWLKQNDAARKALLRDTQPLTIALLDFQTWVEDFDVPKDNILVWGNGAPFDNVVLRGAYKKQGWDAPWGFRGDMCYRTMKVQHRLVLPPDMVGTAHNALDDAKYQAIHLIEIMKRKRQYERTN